MGGLGSGVALGLARLGVKEMILVDKDVVDYSNLNRQILYSKYSSCYLSKGSGGKAQGSNG